MMEATLLPGVVEPGSSEWFRYMTASKIAACMGLSSYESQFSLWHRMAGLIPADSDNDLKRRGHYLEPAIRSWFADQHPEWLIETTGTWVHNERGDQAASPDAIVYADEHPIAVAEFKTAHEDDDWGTPGTDEIPVGYRCQVMWQMDTLGLHRCHIVVLNRHLTFVEYVIDYDPIEAEILRDAASEFMASLHRGDRPDIDSHSQTYLALRQLHPLIEDRDIELDEDLARDYCLARDAVKEADLEEQRTKSLMLDALGSAKRGKYAGKTIAQRQAKGLDGTPYLSAGRNLPTFTPKAA